MASKYELEYAPQPDLCVFLPSGEKYIQFVEGKYETDDKELYKHLKENLGKELKWANKPAKDETPVESSTKETAPDPSSTKKSKTDK